MENQKNECELVWVCHSYINFYGVATSDYKIYRNKIPSIMPFSMVDLMMKSILMYLVTGSSHTLKLM